VGVWRLLAEDRQPERAVALAQTWKVVVLEELAAALENAAQAQNFNDQFIAITRARVDASLRASTLSQVAQALSDWLDANSQAAPDQIPDEASRWRVLSLVAQVASDNEAGKMLLTQMPTAGSPFAEYRNWVNHCLVYIDAELPIVQKQLSDLTTQAELNYSQWGDKNHLAYGLSMYLTVEEADTNIPNAKPVRLDSMAALIGGALGLILWCFIWLGLPIIKERR